jgi:hypothetical protein
MKRLGQLAVSSRPLGQHFSVYAPTEELGVGGELVERCAGIERAGAGDRRDLWATD